MSYIYLILLGIFTGLRTMAGPLALVWGIHFNWFQVQGTPFAFLATRGALITVTLLASIELILDKLPKTPNRTSPPGLFARLVSGALLGIVLGSSPGAIHYPSAILGAMGAIVGAFVGYQLRTRAIASLKTPDFVFALLEDAFAIGGAIFMLFQITH